MTYATLPAAALTKMSHATGQLHSKKARFLPSLDAQRKKQKKEQDFTVLPPKHTHDVAPGTLIEIARSDGEVLRIYTKSAACITGPAVFRTSTDTPIPSVKDEKKRQQDAFNSWTCKIATAFLVSCILGGVASEGINAALAWGVLTAAFFVPLWALFKPEKGNTSYAERNLTWSSLSVVYAPRAQDMPDSSRDTSPAPHQTREQAHA